MIDRLDELLDAIAFRDAVRCCCRMASRPQRSITCSRVPLSYVWPSMRADPVVDAPRWQQ
jgi:hypothetical protein